MVEKYKKYSLISGLIFTVLSAIFSFVFTWIIFTDDIFIRMKEYLFDCGIDVMGTFVCAALYYGSMKQEGNGSNLFRQLIVLTCFGFIVNALYYFTTGMPDLRIFNFVFVLLICLIDLVQIYYFYLYIKESLDIHSRLSKITDKVVPVFLVFVVVILLCNIFTPVTYYIDEAGLHHSLPITWIEDIFLLSVNAITTVLILRSKSPRNQKTAALTFVFLPLFNYVTTIGEFGNASNYGMITMSLVIMYCIIFNYNSSKLAATETELGMATKIQKSMLPSIFPAFPERKEFDLYASMDPAKEVGGDFYDFFMIDDDHLALVMADVSGKGVPAALFMMISKTIIQNFAVLGLGAAETLNRANESLCSQNKMEMFVTVWIGILELSTGRMTCSNAGHEYPAIYHDGKFDLLRDKHGLVLGGMEFARYKEYEIQLYKGDKIFVYTDGVPEATNKDKQLYTTDRMIEALNSNPEGNPKEILKTVRASVDQFVGVAEQFDDLTMACLEYKGKD